MEENVPPGSVCCFCRTTYENEALYGKFYKIEELITHYFCLLLSAKVQQRGSDNEGILGFLPGDIRAEVRRGKNMVCSYCKKRGATISCHSAKCKTHFHLPCGRAKDTFHQFFGEFKSFCFRHRKTQTIKREVLRAMSGKQSTCSICLESVPATPSPSTIWAPCCSKEAWFHRLCIQRLALSAGYFFKCPLCNNTDRFVESMRACGIWIPEQDASWERDPDRYDGLLQRHNSCDAKSCRCRQGRTFHMENTKWEIKLCADCGSQGMHVHCGNLRVAQDWVCAICSNVMSPKKEEKTGKKSLARQSIVARNRARRGLPARPVRRMTRRQLLQSDEEEEAKMDEEFENAEVASPGTIKGSSSGSELGMPPGMCKGAPMSSKDAPAVPVTPKKPVLNEPKDSIPSIVTPASDKEDSDVEIIDLEENSDDEVQSWGAKRNEPLACLCKRHRRGRWSWNVHRSFGSNLSSYCHNRGKKYIHNGKSSSSPIKDSENNLLTRFFSSLASCSGMSLQRGDPHFHRLFVIHHFESPQNSRASGLETTNLRETFSSGSIAAKSTNLRQLIQKRSLSNPCENESLKRTPRKKLKLSPDLKMKEESSRMCWIRRESDNSRKLKRGSQNNSSLHQGRISLPRRQLEKQSPQKSGSQRSKSETRAMFQKGLLSSLGTLQSHSRMQTRSSCRRVSESFEFQNTENEIDSSSKSRKISSQKRSLISESIFKKRFEQFSNESSLKSSTPSVNPSNTSSASQYNLKSRSLRARSSTLRRTCCDSNVLHRSSRCKNYQRSLSPPHENGAKKRSNDTRRPRSGSQFSRKGLVKKKNCQRKFNSWHCEDSDLVIRRTKDQCLPINSEFAKIGNGLALASLSSFQPVVILERSVSKRERSASVERPSEQQARLQGGRSRREQFLKKKEGRTARRAVSHTPRSYQSRSPVRTRSRSRTENSRLLFQAGKVKRSSKTCQTDMLHQQNSNDLKSVLTLDSDAPSEINEVCIDRGPGSDISSSDSYMTQQSDETDWEMIVEEDHIRDTIASMSDDSCFSPIHDETDYEIVVEEDHIEDTIATMSDLRTSGENGFKTLSTTSRPTFLQSSASDGNYDRDKDEFSDSEGSSSFNQFQLSRTSSPHFSADCNFPFSSSFQPSQPSSPSFPHTPAFVRSHPLSVSAPCPSTPPSNSYSSRLYVPSFTNIQPPSSSNSNSTSPPPLLLSADVLSSSMSVGPAESANLVSCQPQQSMSSQPNGSSEPLESLSGNHSTFSVPSPRRSPRSPHNSVPSYNYRAVRKLDPSYPLCVRRSSPPPIFPKRSGSPTEMECRIKARALTARKFVPMSRVATEQRETVRQLQVLQEKQCNPKK